jgi:hypothetical protein
VTEMNSRRMMLGSIAAIAGAGSAALLVEPRAIAAPQTGGAAGGDADRVAGEIRKQLKAALTALQTGSAESARRVAALTQVWTAKIHARTPDAELRARALRAVRRQGRAAILDAPAHHADIEANLRSFGLTAADIARMDLHAPVDLRAREAALDRFLEGGLQPMIDRTVQVLTSAAERLDTASSVRAIAARRWSCDPCIAADMAKAEMEVFCALAALAPMFPPMAVFAELCAVFAAIWLAAYAVCWLCSVWGF